MIGTRRPKSVAEKLAQRQRQEAAALARQEAARMKALRRLADDWPDGMPALNDCTVATLRALVRRDLAAICGFDRLGDTRYKITDAGRAALAAGVTDTVKEAAEAGAGVG